MIEHVSNTKIDKLLFSETLSGTLKSAKAVLQFSTELKHCHKKALKVSTPNPLNRRAPGPGRRGCRRGAASLQPHARRLPRRPPRTWRC